MSAAHVPAPRSATSARSRLAGFARSPQGRRWVRLGRVAFVVGIVTWLAYRVSGIGWGDVWASRPRTPWFYVAWLGLYLQLPLVEVLVFRTLWSLPAGATLLSLLHKRTLNQDVVSGLGEAFFFVWVRHRVALPARLVAGVIKDNLIASSVASWVTIAALAPFAAPVLVSAFTAQSNPRYVLVAGLLIVLLAALGVRFRRTLFTLTVRTVLLLSAVHFGRVVLLVSALQVFQWWVVVPDAPLGLWAAMLVVATAVGRMPFIPAKDLVGIGAILGMMALPRTYEAPIAAMLLTRTVFDKICNLAVAMAHFALDRSYHAPPAGETVSS